MLRCVAPKAPFQALLGGIAIPPGQQGWAAIFSRPLPTNTVVVVVRSNMAQAGHGFAPAIILIHAHEDAAWRWTPGAGEACKECLDSVCVGGRLQLGGAQLLPLAFTSMWPEALQRGHLLPDAGRLIKVDISLVERSLLEASRFCFLELVSAPMEAVLDRTTRATHLARFMQGCLLLFSRVWLRRLYS